MFSRTWAAWTLCEFAELLNPSSNGLRRDSGTGLLDVWSTSWGAYRVLDRVDVRPVDT